jgi:hypothetical protein
MKPIVFALVLCSVVTGTQKTDRKIEADVTAFLTDKVTMPGPVKIRAQSEASRIFAKAGIQLQWKYGNPPAPSAPGTGCRQSRIVAITIRPYAPQDFRDDALGFAALGAGSIAIFDDRIRSITNNAWPTLLPILLAHVFVHEITHQLVQTRGHSEAGIMKAHWTTGDYHDMEEKRLWFTPLDLALIRAAVAPAC